MHVYVLTLHQGDEKITHKQDIGTKKNVGNMCPL
jgi:hypothetical protein